MKMNQNLIFSGALADREPGHYSDWEFHDNVRLNTVSLYDINRAISERRDRAESPSGWKAFLNVFRAH